MIKTMYKTSVAYNASRKLWDSGLVNILKSFLSNRINEAFVASLLGYRLKKNLEIHYAWKNKMPVGELENIEKDVARDLGYII